MGFFGKDDEEKRKSRVHEGRSSSVRYSDTLYGNIDPLVRALCVRNDAKAVAKAVSRENVNLKYGGKSMVIWAVLYRNESALASLINAGADLVKAKNEDLGGAGVVASAVVDSCPSQIVHTLLAHNGKSLLAHRSKDGWTALEVALQTKSALVYDLQRYSKRHSLSEDDLLNLFYAVHDDDVPAASSFLSRTAVSNTDLGKALWMSSSSPMQSLLLKHGASVEVRDVLGNSLLSESSPFCKNHYWEANWSVDPTFAILSQRSGAIDNRDHNGRTPLIRAVATQNKDVVFQLLGLGANPNVEDKDGLNAFDYAYGLVRDMSIISMLENWEQMQELAGATVNLVDLMMDHVGSFNRPNQATPLEETSLDAVTEKTKQYRVFWCGDPVQVERTCFAKGKEVSRAVSSFMCFLAIHKGRKALAEMLLSNGADPFRPVFTGETLTASSAFLVCCVDGSPDLLKVLLQHSQGQIDNVAYHGHAVCHVSNVDTLRALIKAQVDVFGVNREGKNALNVLVSSKLNDSDFANTLVSAFNKDGCHVPDKWGWSAADIALSKKRLPEAFREKFFGTAGLTPTSPEMQLWNGFRKNTFLMDDQALPSLLADHPTLHENLLDVFAHACHKSSMASVEMLVPFVVDQLPGVYHFTGESALKRLVDQEEGLLLILKWILANQVPWNTNVEGTLLYAAVLGRCTTRFYDGLVDAEAIIPNLASMRFWIDNRMQTLVSWACCNKMIHPILHFCQKGNRDWDVNIGGLTVFEEALLNTGDDASWHPARLIASLTETDFDEDYAIKLFGKLKKENYDVRGERTKLRKILRSEEHIDTRRAVLAKAYLLSRPDSNATRLLRGLFKVGEDLLEPAQLLRNLTPAGFSAILRSYSATEILDAQVVLGHYEFDVDIFAAVSKLGHKMDFRVYGELRMSDNALFSVPGFIRLETSGDYPCFLSRSEEAFAVSNDKLSPQSELTALLKQKNGEVPISKLPVDDRLQDLLFCGAAADGALDVLTSMLDLGYLPPLALLNHKWAPPVVGLLFRQLKHLVALESPGFLQRRLAWAVEASNKDAVETLLDIIAKKSYKIKFNRSDSGNMLLTAVNAAREGNPDAVDIARMLLEKGADPSAPDSTRHGYSALDRTHLHVVSSVEVSLVQLMSEHVSKHPRAQLQEKVWVASRQVTAESTKLINSYAQDSKGADPEPNKFLGRVLHAAVAQSPTLVLPLLDAGADLTIQRGPEGELLESSLVRTGRVDLFARVLENNSSRAFDDWKNVVVAAIPKPPFLQLTLKALGSKARHLMSYERSSYLQAGPSAESLELLVDAGLNPKLNLGNLSFLYMLVQNNPKKGVIETAVKRGADTGQIDGWGDIVLHDALDFDVPIDELGFLVPRVDALDEELALRNLMSGANVFHMLPSTLLNTTEYGKVNLFEKKLEIILEGFQEDPSTLAKYLQARSYAGRTPMHSALGVMVQLQTSNKLEPDPLFDMKWRVLSKMLMMYGRFVNYDIDESNNEEIVMVPDETGNTLLTYAIETDMYDFLSLSFIADYVDRELWQKYVRKKFLREAAFYSLFTILYTIVGIMEDRRGHIVYTTNTDKLSFVAQAAVVILALYFSFLEVVEFRYRGKAIQPLSSVLAVVLPFVPATVREKIVSKTVPTVQIYEYLLDWSNVVDGGMLVMFFISILLRFANILHGNDDATDTERILFGVNGIIIWLRMLNYSRQASRMGPLLHMIEEMIRDVVNFMFLFIVFLFAFSTAFFWINYPLPGEEDKLGQFSSFLGTLQWLLEVFFGNFDFANHANENVTVNRLLFLLYLVMSFILLLNLLIAMLSSSYARVEEKAQNQFTMDRIELCLKFWKLNTSKAEKKERKEAAYDLRFGVRKTVDKNVAELMKRQEQEQQSQLVISEGKSNEFKLDSTLERLDAIRSLISRRWKISPDEK